jgi:pyruvate formate lyase activating enzyme
MYKLQDLQPTPKAVLDRAAEIGRKHLDYVYTGNLSGESNTICPECGKAVIKREGFDVLENNLKNGKCSCGHRIAGVWK